MRMRRTSRTAPAAVRCALYRLVGMPDQSISAFWETAVLTRVPAAGWIVALDDELAARAPDRPVASASMIKTFLGLAAVHLCPDWSRRVTVEAEQRAAGDGMLRHLRLPVRLPLGDVVAFAIAMSDNTATNTVIAAAGGLDRVNDELARRGFDARMLRWLSDAGPAARAGTYATEVGIGVCSPREHSRAVAAIADAAARAPTSAYGELHRALHAQQDRRALARWLVEDAPIAHKTGTVGRLRHDGGTLEREGRRLRVACFTDGGPTAEWIDHPACVAMAEAMAWTAAGAGLGGLRPRRGGARPRGPRRLVVASVPRRSTGGASSSGHRRVAAVPGPRAGVLVRGPGRRGRLGEDRGAPGKARGARVPVRAQRRCRRRRRLRVRGRRAPSRRRLRSRRTRRQDGPVARCEGAQVDGKRRRPCVARPRREARVRARRAARRRSSPCRQAG